MLVEQKGKLRLKLLILASLYLWCVFLFLFFPDGRFINVIVQDFLALALLDRQISLLPSSFFFP